jgi:predicted dehydrogenase
MAVAAMRKGKHVYCQKPLSLSFAEGRVMANVAKETGVTFQTGSQQRSDAYFKMAVEFIRNHRLGKVNRVEIGLPKAWHKFYGRKGALASFEPSPVPDGLDYEMWTGPSPMRPYCSALQPLSWRSNF